MPPICLTFAIKTRRSTTILHNAKDASKLPRTSRMACLSTAGVLLLEKIVGRLKIDSGSSFPWNENWIASLQPNVSDLARLKVSIAETDLARETLRDLLQLADQTSSRLLGAQSKLFVQANFVKLPDELFSLIFEFAGYEDLKTTFHISWTSRRFRSIALGNPRLWRFIAELQVEGIEALSERGGNLPISLGTKYIHDIHIGLPPFFRPDPRPGHMFTVLAFAADNVSRIVELHLDLTDMDLRPWKDLLPRVSSLKFPSLQSLQLSDDGYRGKTFFENWEMPSLRTFKHNNSKRGILITLRPDVLASLTALQIECAGEDPEDFVSFLSECESLEHLKVTPPWNRKDAFKGGFPYENADDCPFVELPRLKSLTIRFVHQRSDTTHVKSLLQCVKSPNLQSFTVAVTEGLESKGNDWVLQKDSADRDFKLVDCIRKTAQRAKASLKELNITLQTDDVLSYLGKLCESLPALDNLYITKPLGFCGPSATRRKGTPSHLRLSRIRFKFENCKGMNFFWLLFSLYHEMRMSDVVPSTFMALDGKEKKYSTDEIISRSCEIYETYESYVPLSPFR